MLGPQVGLVPKGAVAVHTEDLFPEVKMLLEAALDPQLAGEHAGACDCAESTLVQRALAFAASVRKDGAE